MLWRVLQSRNECKEKPYAGMFSEAVSENEKYTAYSDSKLDPLGCFGLQTDF
jgi:hypothetical protein